MLKHQITAKFKVFENEFPCMASKNEKNRIRDLAAKGESVNSIKERLGLPKSTVYYHFRKEVGQKQKENALKLPEDDEIIGELCGIFAGDGNFYNRGDGHYKIDFVLNHNDEYWQKLANHLESVLEKRPADYHEKPHSRTKLRYYSRDLYDLFRKYLSWEESSKTSTISLKNKDMNTEFQIGFIRGLIDTDGYKEKKFRRYIYGTVSEELRNNFSYILDDLGIEHTNYTEEPTNEEWQIMNKTRISGESAEKLSNKIKPRHPKKQYNSSK